MKRNGTQWRRPGSIFVAWALVFLCLWSPVFPAVTALMPDQGYLFMHPFFASRAWKASLNRLDVVMPDDSLAKYRPQGFDVSLGRDNAVAVFTTNGGSLFCMPALLETFSSPCLDNALTFDNPRRIAPGRLAIGDPRAFYVVKDSMYSYDSLRVVVPSSVTPLKLYIARIGLNGSSVTRLDSITLVQSWAGQRILGIFGDPDPVTRQDRGIWVTGAQGLIRRIPYTNHQWGAVALRDLADKSTVLHTNGVYAGTSEGRLYKFNGTATFNLESASAGQPVWRVYQQGAIGDNGLFKENSAGVWKQDAELGFTAFRYANFIRRPGGFGVELLDSNWGYSVHTYRDTSSVVQSTVPSSLRDSIGRAPFAYSGVGTLAITFNLNDPDSNYSDYRLFLNGSTDLKTDGVNTINYATLPDSETCRIGALKMTSGSVRLALTPDSLKVMHDCVIGALNTTCNSCYWKPYTFAKSRRWYRGDVVVLMTSTQMLRISNGIGLVVSVMRPGPNSVGSPFRARLAGSGIVLEFPLKTGAHATGVVIHDLSGRQLASLPVHDQRMVSLPAISPAAGVIIVTCVQSDGSLIRRKVPVLR